MSTTLRRALTEEIDAIPPARLDVNELVGLGEQRLRRRRLTAALGSVVAVVVVIALAVGGAVLSGSTDHGQGPSGPGRRHGDNPSSNAQNIAQPQARPIVYVDGGWPMRRIHVGDQTVDISDQLPPPNNDDDEWGMVFLQVTSDGVVLLTHDGRVWFTDGDEVVPIGQLGYQTRIITLGALKTGMSGSIAAWVEQTTNSAEMVVYDTSRRAEVARIACPGCGEPEIAGSHVYWSQNSGVSRDLRMMFDPQTGKTRRVPATAYAEDLADHPRALIVGDSQAQGQVGTGLGQEFLGVDGRLVPLAESDHSGPAFTKAWDTGSGKQLALRLPASYDGQGFRIFDWLDDDRIALEGYNDREPDWVRDVLVCRISTGGCRVAVPGTRPRFVANIGFD